MLNVFNFVKEVIKAIIEVKDMNFICEEYVPVYVVRQRQAQTETYNSCDY